MTTMKAPVYITFLNFKRCSHNLHQKYETWLRENRIANTKQRRRKEEKEDEWSRRIRRRQELWLRARMKKDQQQLATCPSSSHMVFYRQHLCLCCERLCARVSLFVQGLELAYRAGMRLYKLYMCISVINVLTSNKFWEHRSKQKRRKRINLSSPKG